MKENYPIEHWCDHCQMITQFKESGTSLAEIHLCQKCGKLFSSKVKKNLFLLNWKKLE